MFPAAVLVVAMAGCTVAGTPIDGASTDSGAPAATGVGSPGSGPVGGTDPGTARQDLATLTVGPLRSMAGYSRARFPTWSEQGGGCNTRDVVLKRQGRDVTATATCKITHGIWVSPY